jgi:hypothetical protein
MFPHYSITFWCRQYWKLTNAPAENIFEKGLSGKNQNHTGQAEAFLIYHPIVNYRITEPVSWSLLQCKAPRWSEAVILSPWKPE